MVNNGVNIAKCDPFFGGKLQLPANPLFCKKGRPATLPRIGLRRGRECIIKVEAKLRLIAPFMKMRELLSENKGVVGIQWTGREEIHHQKAVVSVCTDRPDLGD
ncbi:hypothetical protein D3C73_1056640 [compost metagenome]